MTTHRERRSGFRALLVSAAVGTGLQGSAPSLRSRPVAVLHPAAKPEDRPDSAARLRRAGRATPREGGR